VGLAAGNDAVPVQRVEFRGHHGVHGALKKATRG